MQLQHSADSLGRQLPPPRCLLAMLIWGGKITNTFDIERTCLIIQYYYIITLATGKSRSSPSTSRRPRASKKSRPNVRLTEIPRMGNRSLQQHRKACTSMYCVYVGPQELGELLAGHESVGSTPALHDIQPASLAHVQAPRARQRSACYRSSLQYLKSGRLAVCLRIRWARAPGARFKLRKLSQEA